VLTPHYARRLFFILDRLLTAEERCAQLEIAGHAVAIFFLLWGLGTGAGLAPASVGVVGGLFLVTLVAWGCSWKASAAGLALRQRREEVEARHRARLWLRVVRRLAAAAGEASPPRPPAALGQAWIGPGKPAKPKILPN